MFLEGSTRMKSIASPSLWLLEISQKPSDQRDQLLLPKREDIFLD